MAARLVLVQKIGVRVSAGQLFDLLAQLVEQYTFNVWVQGSSP